MVQQLYLAEWHDNFVRYINRLVVFVEGYLLLPQATEDYKKELEKVKEILNGKDVEEIKKNLADGAKSGVLKKGVIEKIEKLDKEIIDFISERISIDSFWKEFLRQLSVLRIEQENDATIEKLKELRIPVV